MDIGSPIFDKITIHLNQKYYKGDKIEIIAQGTSDTMRYVQEMEWNATVLSKPEIEHKELTNGGVLKLIMTDIPKK